MEKRGKSYLYGLVAVALLSGTTLSAGSVLSGTNNSANGTNAVVAGGNDNTALGDSSVVVGGSYNSTNYHHSTIGGGIGNSVNLARFSTVSGGSTNRITNSQYSIIGGGYHNVISSFYSNSTIGGGKYNTIDSDSYSATISGGENNRVRGKYSVIPGGLGNYINGDSSFVYGYKASLTGDGSVFFTDNTDLAKSRYESKTFIGQFDNGYLLYTDGEGTAGVSLSHGDGAWNTLSDINQKENHEEVNGEEVLEALSHIPIMKWNYITQDETKKHIGPFAQDFYAAFGLNGDDDTSISTIDTDGIALKSIQTLYKNVKTLKAENADLKARLERLEEVLKNRL